MQDNAKKRPYGRQWPMWRHLIDNDDDDILDRVHQVSLRPRNILARFHIVSSLKTTAPNLSQVQRNTIEPYIAHSHTSGAIFILMFSIISGYMYTIIQKIISTALRNDFIIIIMIVFFVIIIFITIFILVKKSISSSVFTISTLHCYFQYLIKCRLSIKYSIDTHNFSDSDYIVCIARIISIWIAGSLEEISCCKVVRNYFDCWLAGGCYPPYLYDDHATKRYASELASWGGHLSPLCLFSPSLVLYGYYGCANAVLNST